jgi:hypothetical protein
MQPALVLVPAPLNKMQCESIIIQEVSIDATLKDEANPRRSIDRSIDSAAFERPIPRTPTVQYFSSCGNALYLQIRGLYRWTTSLQIIRGSGIKNVEVSKVLISYEDYNFVTEFCRCSLSVEELVNRLRINTNNRS